MTREISDVSERPVNPTQVLNRVNRGRPDPGTDHRSSDLGGSGREDARDQDGATMKSPKDLGMTMLAVWLIAFGLLTVSFLKISFAHSGDVLAVLAIAAGVLLLMRR
jgi:hypothetical protein